MNKYYESWIKVDAERDFIFRDVLSKFNNQLINILEIGASRDLNPQAHLGDGWADFTWAQYIKNNGGHLTIVELDGAALENCKILTEDFKEQITYVNGCGLEYLKNTKEKFDLVYLDGPDDLQFTVDCFELVNRKESVILLDDFHNGGKKSDMLKILHPDFKEIKCRGCDHAMGLYEKL